MRILIVSIDHFVQTAKNGDDSAALAARKNKLESLLKQEIAARNIQFIAEEASSEHRTIAQELASAGNPKISRKNIDMTKEERKQAKIYDALNNRPIYVEKRGSELVEIEVRIPEDDIREEFFVAETIRCAGEAESIMILCGDMHVDAVKEKLERYGHRVEKDESLITDKRWVSSEDAGRKSVCPH
jgi:hypothetical protein